MVQRIVPPHWGTCGLDQPNHRDRHRPMTLDDVYTRWANRRSEFERLGALVDGAKVIDAFLSDLESEREARESEVLSLRAAAVLSGYSADHLARLVRDGRIPNAGRKHAPKIRRADLPRKLGNALERSTKDAYDPVADARALLSRRGGR